jgi:chromatin remodeling complex protein RSC6
MTFHSSATQSTDPVRSRQDDVQNPQNKREILADAKLQAIFGGKSKVSMFEMNKHLAQHLS